jgi:lysophospholipase L1-like esterase
MIAVDGDYVGDVWRQVRSLPGGATHIFVSAGGNDAPAKNGGRHY